MSLTIRERSQKVADCIKTDANQGIESIASAIGISKSSVHRHQQGIARRNQYAESELWETASGSSWLKRLVIGVLYHFGIKHGIGAESLSEFFKSVHLATHVGTSASALRHLNHRLEAVIEMTQPPNLSSVSPSTHRVSASGETKPSLDCRYWYWWSWRVALLLQKLNVRIVSMRPGDIS